MRPYAMIFWSTVNTVAALIFGIKVMDDNQYDYSFKNIMILLLCTLLVSWYTWFYFRYELYRWLSKHWKRNHRFDDD